MGAGECEQGRVTDGDGNYNSSNGGSSGSTRYHLHRDPPLAAIAVAITPSPAPPLQRVAIAIATSPHQTNLNRCDREPRVSAPLVFTTSPVPIPSPHKTYRARHVHEVAGVQTHRYQQYRVLTT